jgi:hypothetical protein
VAAATAVGGDPRRCRGGDRRAPRRAPRACRCRAADRVARGRCERAVRARPLARRGCATAGRRRARRCLGLGGRARCADQPRTGQPRTGQRCAERGRNEDRGDREPPRARVIGPAAPRDPGISARGEHPARARGRRGAARGGGPRARAAAPPLRDRARRGRRPRRRGLAPVEACAARDLAAALGARECAVSGGARSGSGVSAARA